MGPRSKEARGPTGSFGCIGRDAVSIPVPFTSLKAVSKKIRSSRNGKNRSQRMRHIGREDKRFSKI